MATNNIYQYSVLSALMEGICQTGITVRDTLANGDHGIGTVSNLNGEIVIIDGEAYHFPPGESLRKLELSDALPFIMITWFKPTIEKLFPSLKMASLPEALDPLLPSQQNCFLSIRIDALFDHITFRVMERQSRPRESLAELAKRQKVFAFEAIEGTLFGFWSPAFSGGFSVAGFHLHFLSKDKTKGGHVLEFDTKNALLQAAAIDEYRVELPQNEEFNQEVIKSARDEDLHAAEGSNCC
ncbi:Alpha-acetolactate decarboxylase [Penicillium manginii]|jgi:alpha-acetolactate decarboxylase|uniref:Alpha-acetolactate decarboxylase n=1 Tax=Penicillium manginii TaxID=203109 RepID=UPI0025479DCE|nr:Alpha-acetolactate decarboxylase [Penicillium manginii]KAJ5741255.1 Alpha-acetolactate decarboxylase [Penicillium manginii]